MTANEKAAALIRRAMKSLEAIHSDNRMTARDFGGMCQWFVFRDGDLVACFVYEDTAREFIRNSRRGLTLSQAKS